MKNVGEKQAEALTDFDVPCSFRLGTCQSRNCACVPSDETEDGNDQTTPKNWYL